VFLSRKKKEYLVPKWMSRPGAPTPCGPISTSEVVVCGNFYSLSNDVSQVSIKLPPPPHIHGLLQRYSNHMPLLVCHGLLSVNFTLGRYSFRCGKKQNANQCSKKKVRNFDFELPTRRSKSNLWHCVVKRWEKRKCGPGSGANLDLIFVPRF